MISYTEDSPHFFRKQENTTSHKFQRLMAKNEQNVLMAKADPQKNHKFQNIRPVCSLFCIRILDYYEIKCKCARPTPLLMRNNQHENFLVNALF